VLDSRLFRRRLAARIVGLLGGASVAAPFAGCNYDYGQLPGGDGVGGGGTSSSTGTTTSTSTTTTSTTGITMCVPWMPGAACPTPDGLAQDMASCFFILQQLQQMKQVLSGPQTPTTNNGECCYQVEVEPCGVPGRPYLVEDRAQVAPLQRAAGTRGWTEGSPPHLDGLTAPERASLAEAWAADALLEHASVASFARFSLALLAAGAPAHLVELAHQAALDEIRHARLCFALAAAYAGADLAPGTFPLGGDVRVEATLEAIAVSTVHEGCIGETVAAVIAAEQLARATDPAVRAALAVIVADEARHSELA
jgi:hypothetical protein